MNGINLFINKVLSVIIGDFHGIMLNLSRTNKKIPRGPPSPPAPVMHSPNRKVYNQLRLYIFCMLTQKKHFLRGNFLELFLF